MLQGDNRQIIEQAGDITLRELGYIDYMRSISDQE